MNPHRDLLAALAAFAGGLSGAALDVAGLIPSSVTWRLADSPVHIQAISSVASGATLTIEAGVEVRLYPRVFLAVEGRLIASGESARPVRFVRHDPATPWRRIDFLPGGEGSRLTWCEIEGAGNTGNLRASGTELHLEHVVFRNTTSQAVAVENSSLTALHCEFPDVINDEQLQIRGLPADGHARIEGCVFHEGVRSRRVVDCSGGTRPGPVAEFRDNVFLGSRRDVMAFAGNDAHIEGNVFLNVRQDAAGADAVSAIVAGTGPEGVSDLMICRNLFYHVDHALRLEHGGRAVMQNNTIVHLPDNPMAPVPVGVLDWDDAGVAGDAAGACLFEGNLVWQVAGERLVTRFSGQPLVVRHSLLPAAWPGEGNVAGSDPLLMATGALTAATVRQGLTLRAGSPAIGAGPNGLDIGAMVPAGVSLSGEPAGSTTAREARLRVAGPGMVAYRWRVDGGPWSPEWPLTNGPAFTPMLFDDAPPVSLSGLAVAVHRVEAMGRDSAGHWSDVSTAARSRPWIVREAPLRILGIVPGREGVELRCDAVAGAMYHLESRSALGEAPWTPDPGSLSPTASGSLRLRHAFAADRGGEYLRIVETPR
ncbi:MAG: hypothetical protein J0L84_01055 [Verrucomicrobia bacterium]|nr:hypothetical protein [Verrucomicrobiota bacterium]